MNKLAIALLGILCILASIAGVLVINVVAHIVHWLIDTYLVFPFCLCCFVGIAAWEYRKEQRKEEQIREWTGTRVSTKNNMEDAA